MIKRVIYFTLLIIILWFGFQMVINFLKTEHYVEYTLDIANNIYNIKENYKKTSEEDQYFLEVNISDMSFLFTSENKFNKQKEIVKDIKTYSTDDIFCMSLIYINDEYVSSPICSKNGKLYSYLSLKDDYDLTEFLASIPNFSSKLFNKNDESIDYSDLYIYDKYLYSNETLLVYNYKSIIKIANNKQEELYFSSFDNYKNEFGTLVDNYYLIPRITSNPEFSLYLAFDIKNNSIKEINLSNKISKQAYINGTYDNKLYIFDKSDLIQYSINPANREITIVGNKDNPGFIYQNGENKEISVYDLNKENVYFSDNIDSYKDIKYDSIFNFNDYAIYIVDGKFYKVYKDHINNPILLFETANPKEIRIKNDRIYYIDSNFLYRFDDYGLVPLVKREEFKYNYYNIYDVYTDF